MSELLDTAGFAALLEKTMRDKKLTHIDAIIEICEMKNLDVESIPSLLTPKLRKSIQVEAVTKHMIKPRKARKAKSQIDG